MTATLGQIGWAALSSSLTVQTSYEIARACIEKQIPGDFVECGVFAGVQCAAMAIAVLEAGVADRKIHLFDSFEGIPKGGEFDNDLEPLVGRRTGSGIEPSGKSICSLAQVREYMAIWEIPDSLLVYHPGWFHETVPAAQVDRIALLRLDGDLYDSTKICLEHLYPKLVPGGWCVIDDFELDGCRKAVLETVKTGPIYFRK